MSHELCDHTDIDAIISIQEPTGMVWFQWALTQDEMDYASQKVTDMQDGWVGMKLEPSDGER
jgi:hypothetical protein